MSGADLPPPSTPEVAAPEVASAPASSHLGLAEEPRVREIMTTAVLVCQQSDTCEEVAERMRQESVGMFPVLDGDKLVGVVTDRDLVVRHLAAGGRRIVHRAVVFCMTPKVTTIPPGAPLREALRRMREGRFRRLPVVDDGHLVGVISLDDIVFEVGRLASAALVIQESLKDYREKMGKESSARRSGSVLRAPLRSAPAPPPRADPEPRPAPTRRVVRRPLGPDGLPIKGKAQDARAEQP